MCITKWTLLVALLCSLLIAPIKSNEENDEQIQVDMQYGFRYTVE